MNNSQGCLCVDRVTTTLRGGASSGGGGRGEEGGGAIEICTRRVTRADQRSWTARYMPGKHAAVVVVVRTDGCRDCEEGLGGTGYAWHRGVRVVVSGIYILHTTMSQ